MTTPRYAYRLGWRSVAYIANLDKPRAKVVADALGPAFHAFGITTRQRACAALAQMAHESDGFKTTREYASGREYDITVNPEVARELGNMHPGDGELYKGRGYIQVTGRGNYTELTHALGVNFVAAPGKLEDPHWAAQASCWWWLHNGCNTLADTDDFVALTRRINGGTNGLASREAYWARAKRVAPFLVPKRRKP